MNPPKTPTPVVSPCDALVQARAQMYLLAAGQAVVSIETPQLGRVEFNRGSIGDLQRLIDSLAADCAASLGVAAPARRRPINIEACP